MTIALSEGGHRFGAVDMERAPRRQPRSPKEFQTPRRQHSPSARPNSEADTESVHREDPPPQREGRLFGRRTPRQVIAATQRLVQLEAVVRDNHGGPCSSARAIEYVEDFITFAAIAGGQAGFRWLLDEIVVRLFPLMSDDELEGLIEKAQLDPLPYTSAALGKRHGVTAEQYERLGLTHITPAGWGKRRLENYRAKRRNKRVKDVRHATNASKTRRELSIEQLRPWRQPGAPCKSRAGFYRLAQDTRDALIASARTAALMRP